MWANGSFADREVALKVFRIALMGEPLWAAWVSSRLYQTLLASCHLRARASSFRAVAVEYIGIRRDIAHADDHPLETILSIRKRAWDSDGETKTAWCLTMSMPPGGLPTGVFQGAGAFRKTNTRALKRPTSHGLFCCPGRPDPSCLERLAMLHSCCVHSFALFGNRLKSMAIFATRRNTEWHPNGV